MESAAIGILALSGIAAVAAILALAFGRHVVAALDSAFSKWRRLGFVGRIITAAMVVVATVEAQKGESEGVRSDGVEELRGGFPYSPTPSLTHSPNPTLTHYLTSVKTNTSYSYEMPENAVRYPNWWMRGGYEDVFQLDFGEWRFPLGTASVSSLWVYIWGNARSCLRGGYGIAAIGAPMSAVPQVSQFWHSDGTNGSKILTWHNFFVGRVPLSELNGSQSNCLTQSPQSSLSSPLCVSAQLELFPNGDYIARSNLVERYFKRVNPDDWDDDGIPNIVDANPEGSDGDFFGPNNNLPEGANSNNYCWVEVAVSNVNSLVVFVGDKPSNLPDPHFVAKAGISHRVNLLIGKTYRVTSAQPIVCTAKSSEEISVDQDDERTMTIVYPVSYEIVDNARSISRQVRMVPPLVGMYTWNTNTCCEAEKTDGPYLPTCAPSCTCNGSCDTGGFIFSYEGYSLDFGDVECGCRPKEGDDEEEMKPASVEVAFSRKAIIYEEAYETAPGVTVPLRSTESVLTCSASGGPKGGTVEFVLADGNRLVKGGGSLPYTRELAPGDEVRFDIVCTGQGESSGEDDVVVNGIFTENETGEVLAAEDRLTVVRVDFIPELQAPENHCIRRHKVGVREKIGYECIPNLHAVEWINTGNGRFADAEYICSLDSEENPIKVRYKDVDYMPSISVVAPNGIEAASVWHKTYGASTNQAGEIGMRFELRVRPLDVCFSGIAVEEVPCDIGSREGYFAYPIFAYLQSHTFDNGAGRWSKVRPTNILEYIDEASIESLIPRITPDGILTNDLSFGWIDGRVEWDIPMGWGEENSVIGDNPYKKFAEDTKAEMRIFSSGQSGVRKFQHQVTRYIDGRIFLDMKEIKP